MCCCLTLSQIHKGFGSGGRPNSHVTKGHLETRRENCSANTEVFESPSRFACRKSRRTGRRSRVGLFRRGNPHRIGRMCPNRRTYGFCDAWLLGTLRSLQYSKWPLVTGLLGLSRIEAHGDDRPVANPNEVGPVRVRPTRGFLDLHHCERGRHHLADGWPILLFRTPTPILAQPEAALDR